MRHTLIKFKDTQTLIQQYKNYINNNYIHNPIVVVGVVQVLGDVEPFHKGEYILLVHGESWCHRDNSTIEALLGIEGVVDSIAMNSKLYYYLGYGNISNFLFKYFHVLCEKEAEELLSRKLDF